MIARSAARKGRTDISSLVRCTACMMIARIQVGKVEGDAERRERCGGRGKTVQQEIVAARLILACSRAEFEPGHSV